MTSAAVIQVPVRLDTYGMVGGLNVIVRQKAPNSARIGSSIDEWAATSMCTRVVSTSRAASVASSSSTSATGPEATQRSAVLIAAMLRPSGSTSRSSSSDSGTLTIAPFGNVSNSRPRNAMSASPSSIDTTSERQAAAYSPALWPIIAAGVIPHDSSSRPIATSVANSAGSATDGASSRTVASSRSPAGKRAASRSTPPASRRASAQSSMTARYTGSSSYSWRPMAAYWAPPPGIMNTTLGGSPWWWASTGLAGASRRSAASTADVATTARRMANALRPASRVKATSARSMSGWARRWAASSVAARRATSAVRPDTVIS